MPIEYLRPSSIIIVSIMVAVLIAITQPALSAGHLLHVQGLETEHGHLNGISSESHFHQHHQVNHIDLNLIIHSDWNATQEIDKALFIAQYNLCYVQCILQPEIPPPIT